MSYFSSITQNVIADSNNSSSANLDSLSSFTGIGTSTLGIVGIQVSLKTDQNCTVWVEQSPDNINWDVSDNFTYYTIKPFGTTIQAVNSYVRIRVKNISSSATTYFRLQTALCPVVEAVPRALSQKQNFKISINEFLEDPMAGVQSTPTNELRTTTHVKLVGAAFEGSGNSGSPDPNFWTVTTAGSGSTVSQTGGNVALQTGTSANGTVSMFSVATGRYVAGSTNYFRCVSRVIALTGTCTTRWGAFDTNYGYFFEWNGTTLSLVSRKGTVDTPVTSFSGDYGSVYSIDINAHTYEIIWSNKSVWYYIDGQFLHKISGNTTTQVDSPTLKIGLQCINSGSTTANNILNCRVASISRLGQLDSESRYKYVSSTAATSVCKYGAGRLHRIICADVSSVGTITAYDNSTSAGTIISTINIASKTTEPTVIEYGCPFFTGLTIVNSGIPVTIIYE